MDRKKLIIIIAAVLFLTLIGWKLASGGQQVQTVDVTRETISQQVEDTAIVKPVSNEKIFASQNARVAQVNAEIGQQVVKGQVILRLDSNDLGIQLTETHSRLAQANTSITSAEAKADQLSKELSSAQTDFKRVESLYQQKVISQDEYEKAALKVETAASDLKQQRSLLNSVQLEVQGLASELKQLENKSTELEVVSPITGTILDIPVQQAEMVTAGNLLVSVGSSNDLELEADILSDDLADIKVGQTVTISAPVLAEKKVNGRVIKIYPRAEEQMSALGVVQRRVPVIIAINNQTNLKPGYEVRIAIETNRREKVLIVPLESVRSLANQQKQVMLIRDNRVVYQKVRTGLSDRNNIEITSGLKAGDRVVRDASLDIKARARIKSLTAQE